MDKGFIIFVVVLCTITGIVVVLTHDNNSDKRLESAIEPSTIETKIQIGKIVCTKPIAHDNCLEFTIYRTVKE